MLLILLLLVGGGVYYFAVVAAGASVAVPAQLLVVTPTAIVLHSGSKQPGKSGTLIREGDSVSTTETGRAAIQFEDGSSIKVAPNSEVVLTSAQFSKKGDVQSVVLEQKAGRTYSTVERLIGSNASFSVHGHAANATVRGTKFQVISGSKGETTLRVADGKVRMDGKTGVTVSAGSQVVADPQGVLGPVTPTPPDPADPFRLWNGSEAAAKSAGQPGNAATTYSPTAIATGQTANQPDYVSSGGDLVGDLVYPGSQIRLKIVGPDGVAHESDTSVDVPGLGKKVEIVILNSAPGVYKVSVIGEDVNPSEEYSVTMSVKFVCKSGNSDPGSAYIRNILGAKETAAALTQSGASGVNVNFSGASAGGVNISASGTFNGVSMAGSGVLYAAGGYLGAKVTSASISGFNVTQQITDAVSQSAGKNLDQIDVGFYVDRIYTCNSSGGSYMVLEGHQRP